VLAARDALSDVERAAASRAIAGASPDARTLPPLGRSSSRFRFATSGTRRVLVRAAMRAGKTIAAPRVDNATRMLELYAIADPDRDVA
jgi:hypothetical protein